MSRPQARPWLPPANTELGALLQDFHQIAEIDRLALIGLRSLGLGISLEPRSSTLLGSLGQLHIGIAHGIAAHAAAVAVAASLAPAKHRRQRAKHIVRCPGIGHPLRAQSLAKATHK